MRAKFPSLRNFLVSRSNLRESDILRRTTMDIQGTWFNELGSTMVLRPVSRGQFSGDYRTAVSATACARGVFRITRRSATDIGGDTLGFVVSWNNRGSVCKSVAAWSGQAQTINGVDQINAFWLLTVESNPDMNWYATHVGQDVFTRTRPTDEVIERNLQSVRQSHP